MKTIETAQQAGPDGMLRLEIPVDRIGSMYHVIIIVSEQPVDSPNITEWPSGYFESTIGKWQGDFAIESEGPFERREPL